MWLNGKVRRFEGCADASYPYYIYETNRNESVTYANEVNKRGRACYLASGGRTVPDTADAVTGAVPQFIRLTEDYAPRLVDKFIGRYALMVDSPFVQQTVRKDLVLTGTLAVDKGIESRNSLLVAPAVSNYVLRGYFPAAGMAQIEVCQGSAVKGAIKLNAANGEVSILSRGVVSATFYEDTCRVTGLSTTKPASGCFISPVTTSSILPNREIPPLYASTIRAIRTAQLTSATSRSTTASGVPCRCCKSAVPTNG